MWAPVSRAIWEQSGICAATVDGRRRTADARGATFDFGKEDCNAAEPSYRALQWQGRFLNIAQRVPEGARLCTYSMRG